MPAPRALAAAALLLALCIFGYWPGLDGPFLLDDGPRLLADRQLQIERLDVESLVGAARAGDQDGLPRPLARVSFALNYYFAGQRFSPFAFKLTNVVIHALNALLVFALCLRLCPAPRRAKLAFAVAAIWAVHPIALTAVLYTVQRMTSLSALCVLLGLLLYVVGRQRLAAGRSRGAAALMLMGLLGGMGLGMQFKENAALLPVFAILVELSFFAPATAARRTAVRLLAGVLALVAVLGTLAVLSRPDIFADAYLVREFTPLERLLTQSRVLWFYLALLAVPRLPAFGLFHDDIVTSQGLLMPWTTALSVVAWALLIGLALWGIGRRRIWAFAVLWFLGGHLLESTLIGLEMVFEHRNYLPSLGPLGAAVYYAHRWLAERPRWRRAAPLLAGAAIAVLGATTATRAYLWRDPLSFAEAALRHHPESSRSHGVAARAREHAGMEPTLVFATWQGAARLAPGDVLPVTEMARLQRRQATRCRERSADAGTGKRPDSDAQLDVAGLAARDVFVAATRCNGAALAHLQAALDAAVVARLEHAPVSATTVAALRRAAGCVLADAGDCPATAERLGQWLTVAIRRARGLPAQRAALIEVRAQIGARGSRAATAGRDGGDVSRE